MAISRKLTRRTVLVGSSAVALAAITGRTQAADVFKIGLLAHISGYAPAIAIEFARKGLMSEVRPTFSEIDEATADWQLAA